MDEGNTCSSLLTWMRTFDVEPICFTVNDISDGVAMSRALHHIDPVWFDEAFLAKIKTDIGSNWRLKISNLKKVLKAIVDYYQEVLGQSLEADSLPDVALLGEHAHSGEAGKLLQLLLGCAVHCAKRDEHIQTIMTLEESIQHVVMAAIQKLMMRDVDVTTAEPLRDIETQLQHALNDLGEALQARDEALRQCQVVKLQVYVHVLLKSSM
uniref:protein Hook homolog 3-like n=1 Tax=Myxine glutinosa TaxID=7769 RepID=UPI00358E3DCE